MQKKRIFHGITGMHILNKDDRFIYQRFTSLYSREPGVAILKVFQGVRVFREIQGIQGRASTVCNPR